MGGKKIEDSTVLHLRVPNSVYKKIEDRAEKEGRTVHNLANFILREGADK